MKKSVGILGIGRYVPENVRTKESWPTSVVEAWAARRASTTPITDKEADKHKDLPTTPGARLVMEAMAELRNDPFHGSVERRVVDKGVLGSEMELFAAKSAIATAGIRTADIGLIMCDTMVPDYLGTNNGCLLHHNVGASASCITISTQNACNAFMLQLSVAEQMILSGRAKYALLVQNCNVTPLINWEHALSPWFGDGCAAVVVGAVREDRGLLAHTHRTDGRFHKTIVTGVPGDARWYEGAVTVFSADPEAARRSFLCIPEHADDVVGDVLAQAGVSPRDIEVYIPHQPTKWFRDVTQRHLGLSQARHVDTFSKYASMSGANVAYGYDLALTEGKLRDGDLVLSFAAGAGLTYSAMVMRWGG